jgi:hypothetical protein
MTEHIQVRSVDLAVAPADAAAITDRAEAIYTLTGGGTVSAVANVGYRLTVSAAASDAVLVQTPERLNKTPEVAACLTGLFTGTQLGRRYEIGFIDGAVGAFFRIDDGVLRLVVRRNTASDELVTVVSSDVVVDVTRVHTWRVVVKRRREVEFLVDGTSLGSIAATTAVMAQLLEMRAGVQVSNPLAAVGTAGMDVHFWSMEASQLPVPRRKGNPTSAAVNTLVVKAEAGFLHDLHVLADTATVRYIMVFDKATTPINGDTPVLRLHIKAASVGVEKHIEEPFAQRFAKGVSVAVSTTVGTLTLPGSPEGYFDAGYS